MTAVVVGLIFGATMFSALIVSDYQHDAFDRFALVLNACIVITGLLFLLLF